MTINNEPHFSTGNVAVFSLCKDHSECLPLRETIAHIDPDLAEQAQFISEQEASLEGTFEGLSFSMMAVPAPYPDDELQHYCGHNIKPKNAWSAASSAEAHVAIVVRGKSGEPPRREAVMLAARIALAFSPLAILWSPSKSVHKAHDFKRHIETARSENDWPYNVIIAVADHSGDNTSVIHTRGLIDFTGYEISLPSDQTPDTLLVMAKHLLSENRHLVAGDAISLAESEILWRAQESKLPGDTPALELHLEGQDHEEEAPSSLPSAHDEEPAAAECGAETSPEGSEPSLQDTPVEEDLDHPDGIEMEEATAGEDTSTESKRDTPQDTPDTPKAQRKIRARILHKKEKPVVTASEHRSSAQRKTTKSKADPRETIESTLAAIRAASANAEPEVKPTPKWMFWKR